MTIIFISESIMFRDLIPAHCIDKYIIFPRVLGFNYYYYISRVETLSLCKYFNDSVQVKKSYARIIKKKKPKMIL